MPSNSDNTVEVKIAGTVDPSLGASAAVAKAQIEGIGNSAKISAAEMSAALKAAGGDLSKITPEMLGLETATKAAASASTKAEGALVAVGQATKESGRATGTAAREFRALFDEISSGRTYQTPSTIAILAQRVYGLSTAALIAGGVVIGLAAAIGSLAWNAIKAADAVGRIKLAGDFAGGLGATKDEIAGLINALARIPEVSREDAEQTVRAYVDMGVRSKTALEGLSDAAVRYAQVTGDTAPEAAKKLVGILEEQHLTIPKLQKDFGGLSAEQAEAFIKVQRLGDANQTAAALMQLVADQTKSGRTDWSDYASGVKRVISNFQIYLGWLQGVRSYDEAHQAVLAKNSQLWDAQTDAILRDAAALAGLANAPESALDAAIKLASTSTHSRIIDLQSDIKKLQDELADPKATEEMKENFQSAIQDRQREIQSLSNKSAFSGTGFSNAGAEEIAQAREKVSEINAVEGMGSQERLAQVKQVYAELLASDKLNAAQRLEVQKDLNTALAEANKQASHDQQEIALDDANTEVELARVIYEQRHEELDREVDADRITKQQEIAILLNYLQQIEALQLDALNKQEANLDKDSVAYQRAENRKKIITAETNAKIAQLNADSARDTAKAMEQSWRQMLSQVEGAEDTFISGVLSGRKGLLQSLEAATAQFIESDIKQTVKGMTERLLLTKEELAQDQSLGRLGFIGHLLIDNQKTAATAAGESNRLAIKTAALTVGSQEDVAAGSAQIINDAYKAAAGTYQSVAQIPYVGWILAPIAAGAAFTAVAAFDTLTSFDTGTGNVPHDMVAQIHHGEIITPRSFSDDIRSGKLALVGGDAGAGSGNSGSHTHNWNYSPTIDAREPVNWQRELARSGDQFLSFIERSVRYGKIKLA